ncbi:uncharacterized protein B0I36DRAFT_360354 [Microdochium trichocladiopsis]|uniref:CAP-Gly domain-containing protein n=1 Tax=Microdochium trichocladiopsis TaxID=1682393 RepID=A0A9P9BSX0_9PEZI|nr:uncharacterized protein B0I36DRAFT_360354 [Microdochium trichocladiopsis]KAH7034892.1 hypothetical protein B0I36DRAFT_360354 [Microdochium trichocladiopsis]
MASDLSSVQVGDRRSYDGAPCTIRYIGGVKGTSGAWLGVEWDDPARGKHDGSHKGERYFTCISHSSTAASFVRPTRPAEPARGLLRALVDKYTAELADAAVIKFSGKVAEEVGFAKTRRKQANLGELRVAILDGERIASAYDPGNGDEHEAGKSHGSVSISQTCPKVRDLDLSRNLLRRIGDVVGICSELPALRTLRLNGNRFEGVLEDETLLGDRCLDAFKGLEELAVEDTLMTWEEICHFCARCERLLSLSASTNQLSRLPPTTALLSPSSMTTNLVALTLEFNELTCISDIASLGALKALRNLHLKCNNIRTILPPGDPDQGKDAHANLNPTQYASELPVFSPSVQYIDVSYNNVDSWDFVDSLPTCFPGLTALRFAHNPIYDNPDPDHSSAATTKNLTEEAYMFTVARLPNLKALNFGTISKEDRQDAEMFYLARIGKHLAAIAVPAAPPASGSNTTTSTSDGTINNTAEEEDMQTSKKLVRDLEAALVKRHHPRYAELCELYGAPTVVRRREINPAFIEARLITVHLSYTPSPPHPTSSSPSSNVLAPTTTSSSSSTAAAAAVPTEPEMVTRTVQIPKSLDIYAVKGIVARILGFNATTTTSALSAGSGSAEGRNRRNDDGLGRTKPLDLRLVWETGEWDPVADFDEQVDDDSDDDAGEGEGDEEEEEEDDQEEARNGKRQEPEAGEEGDGADPSPTGQAGGKWIKREVELPDGPRQLGFCVDGQEVRIRVELR